MMKQPDSPPSEEQPIHPHKNPLLRTLHLSLRIIAACFTLALVIGAVLLVAYRDELNLETLRHYLTYSQLSSNSDDLASFVHAGGSDLDFCRLDAGIVMASQAGGHYYSTAGKQYAEAVEHLAIPVLTHSSSAAVVYDGGGQSLSLFTDYNIPFSLTLNEGEELLSARPNDRGWLAVTAQLSGYKGSVSVYDNNHNLAMEINLSSAFIMDAAISPDCKTVAILTIGQSGGVFQSTLLLFPVGKEEPSATIPLGDTVVLDLEYERDLIWLVGSRSLLSLTVDGTLQNYPYGQYHLKGYTLGGDGFVGLLLSEYETGDPNLLVSVGGDGRQQGTQSLIGEVPDIDGAGDYLSILSGTGLTVYTPQLTQYAHLENSQGAQALAQHTDGSVLLAGAQEIWIYTPET